MMTKAITKPADDMIFVFGSNYMGLHGAGAAKYAVENKGAVYGVGKGAQGWSYAIPTKNATDNRVGKPLTVAEIKHYVDDFIEVASMHQDYDFQITQIGCGLAGHTKASMAALFLDAPSNCYFDIEWFPYLGSEYHYWR